MGAFKHLAVTRQATDDHPIFAGPMFLHGNSDFMSYHTFFSHLSALLSDCPSPPPLGSDDERAMKKAM